MLINYKLHEGSFEALLDSPHLSLYPEPVRPMELLRSLLTLECDMRQVLVDCVELEAAESFLLEDRFESWLVFRVTVQLFRRRGWFTTNLSGMQWPCLMLSDRLLLKLSLLVRDCCRLVFCCFCCISAI